MKTAKEMLEQVKKEKAVAQFQSILFRIEKEILSCMRCGYYEINLNSRDYPPEFYEYAAPILAEAGFLFFNIAPHLKLISWSHLIK